MLRGLIAFILSFLLFPILSTAEDLRFEPKSLMLHESPELVEREKIIELLSKQIDHSKTLSTGADANSLVEILRAIYGSDLSGVLPSFIIDDLSNGFFHAQSVELAVKRKTGNDNLGVGFEGELSNPITYDGSKTFIPIPLIRDRLLVDIRAFRDLNLLVVPALAPKAMRKDPIQSSVFKAVDKDTAALNVLIHSKTGSTQHARLLEFLAARATDCFDGTEEQIHGLSTFFGLDSYRNPGFFWPENIATSAVEYRQFLESRDNAVRKYFELLSDVGDQGRIDVCQNYRHNVQIAMLLLKLVNGIVDEEIYNYLF